MKKEKLGGMITKLWFKFKGKPFGYWIFMKLLCLKAPYFGTIKPKLIQFEKGFCQIALKKRRRVLNHIGTVHALAMGNLCELAAGLAIDHSLPSRYRWIPMGMRIDYLKKAKTDLKATAKVEIKDELGDQQKIVVPVEVKDKNDQVVVKAMIDMWVSK